MEDFEGKKEIINLFNKILGSKVSIKDNISKTEETLFTYFVNPDGAVIPIEDENGKQYKFENPSELWSYLNHRYKK